jgi:hypothetical protein
LSDIRTLIVSPSPRQILQVKEGIDDIRGVPKLLVKYFQEIDAYKIFRDYFLAHKKDFDYLVISPDDLIVGQRYYDMLIKDLEKEQYPILCGVCNVNLLGSPETLAICIDKLPSMHRNERDYGYADFRNKDHPVQNGIIKVKFAGFPFMFIRKDIVEQIDFTGDLPYNLDQPPHQTNAGIINMDLPFCYECDKKGIEIYCDTRVKLVHLAGAIPSEFGYSSDTLLVGKREAKVLLIDRNGKEHDKTEECLKLSGVISPIIMR